MDDEYEGKRKETFRSLFLIYAALCLCKGILPANLLRITDSFGVTEINVVGWVMAIDLTVLTTSILFFGYFGEKFSKHKKKIFALTQLGWAICFGLFTLTQTFLQFSILCVTSAVFRGAFLPIAFSMIGDFYPPRERGAKFGMMNAGLILGSGGGLLFGKLLGDLIPSIGWRIAYALGFVLAILAVEGYVRQGILPERGKHEPELRDMEGEIKYDYKITLTALKKLFKNKTVGVLLISTLIISITTVTLGIWAVAYLESSQLTILGASAGLVAMLFFILTGLGALPGNILGGKWGDKFYKENKLRGRVILSLVGIILGFGLFFGFYLIPLSGTTTLAIVLSAIIILICGFLGFFFSSFSVGNQFAIYSEVCPPEIRATSNAFHGVMVNIGGIIGNLMFAFSITGSSILPFHIALLLAFSIIGGLFWIIPYFTYPKEERTCRDLMAKRKVEMEQRSSE